MAITLKKITLRRKEVDNKPGALADTLALLAQARTDLQAVMGTGIRWSRAKRHRASSGVGQEGYRGCPIGRDWLLHRSRPCSCRATTDPVLVTLSPRRLETPVSTLATKSQQSSGHRSLLFHHG